VTKSYFVAHVRKKRSLAVADEQNYLTSISWAVSAVLKMPIHAHFVSAGDFDPKISQTDLVYGVR